MRAGGVAQESRAVGILPGRLAGREMAADIALGQRAVDRVAQRMDADIGVGMAGQARSSCGTSTPHSTSGRPASSTCTSKPVPMRGTRAADRMPPAAARSSGIGHLDVVLGAGDQRHGCAGPLQQRGVVGGARRPRRAGAAPAGSRSGTPAASARDTALARHGRRDDRRPRPASACRPPARRGSRRGMRSSAASRAGMVPAG